MLFARWIKRFALTPFKIHTELNKNVHAPMKRQRVISAARGWEYFAKDYLSTVFPRVLL